MKTRNEDIFPDTPVISSGAVHELVLKRIRLLSRKRIAWLRKIWSEVAGQGNEAFNAHMEVDGYLHNADVPALEREWTSQTPAMVDLYEAIRETEAILWNDNNSRLFKLIDTFGLNTLETDILHLCLAGAFDQNLGRVFAYMQDHSGRAYITESLVARLFGHGEYLMLNAASPLKTWGLVTETIPSPGEPARLECDPFIKNWILGQDGIDETLLAFASFQPVKKPLFEWPVKKALDFITRMRDNSEQKKLRIFVSGSEGSGRRSFAAIVSAQAGCALLSINSDRIAENRWQQAYTNAQRQALLTSSAVAWYGSNILERFWPQNIPPCELQFVTGEADNFIQPDTRFVDLRIELPVISFEERKRLWQQFVPLSAGWPKAELEEMIRRHQADIGQIVSIGQKMTGNITEAYEALKSHAAHRLGSLAQRIASDFTWDDLVVPAQVKEEIGDLTFEARERNQFWEQAAAKRLFPQGKSLVALFTGSPGTGKTMAAQVIASTLKLDLFRVDLSTVVSKYIGESAKNIERILSRAATMDIVLFFDEADALFGKRTEVKDAHDRYANTDTNYLLQAIEQYPGIIILASNKKSNIDHGFMRRFRYIVDFPKPDAAQRFQLWKKILMELAGEEVVADLNDDLDHLAENIDVTGAQIKLSVLSALFMARRDKTKINLSHLLSGLERELVKEGRGLGRQLKQRLNVLQ